MKINFNSRKTEKGEKAPEVETPKKETLQNCFKI